MNQEQKAKIHHIGYDERQSRRLPHLAISLRTQGVKAASNQPHEPGAKVSHLSHQPRRLNTAHEEVMKPWTMILRDGLQIFSEHRGAGLGRALAAHASARPCGAESAAACTAG